MGDYYEFEIGVVNNQDGNVELTFSIDGVQILKQWTIPIIKLRAGYFTIYSAAKTDVVIMEVDEGERTGSVEESGHRSISVDVK